MKKRTSAALWALFLGTFGAHRFYLDQVGLGFLYLLTFWTGVPIVVAIIDCIIFFTMSDQSFDQKYNNKLLQSMQHTPSHNQHMANHINMGHESDLDRLEKLSRLRDNGVITEDEFINRKARILND